MFFFLSRLCCVVIFVLVCQNHPRYTNRKSLLKTAEGRKSNLTGKKKKEEKYYDPYLRSSSSSRQRAIQSLPNE